MKIKTTIQLLVIITFVFILLSTIYSEQIKANWKYQTSDTAKTIQTKIDIGGYALYVNIAGVGSPTVIFEAGSDNTSSVWRYVQPEISKITRTFSYDRAGLGKSDKRNKPNTSLTQVQELHTLLKKAEVKEPYIFVANSYGTYIAKLFTNMYSDEVAGVVFVDGTNEQFTEYLSNNLSPDNLDVFKKMTDSDPDGNFEEMLISAQQVKDAGKKDALRNKPAIILTADIQISSKQYANTPMSIAFSQWMNWQKDLIALSDRSKQCIVKGSGHLIHIDKPQLVINAIKRMIDYDLKDYPFPPNKIAEISPNKLKMFVGKYLYDVNDILTIKEENGHLFADIPYLIRTEMYPISESEIITKDMDIAATILILTKKGILIKNTYSKEVKNIVKVTEDYLTPNECLYSGRIKEGIAKYKGIKKSDSYNAAINENKLNNLGYNLVNQGKIKEAIAVFKLNIEFYPQSANTYNSIGEAYMKASDKKLAIENYEKSLELNPNNKNSAETLKQLKEKK